MLNRDQALEELGRYNLDAGVFPEVALSAVLRGHDVTAGFHRCAVAKDLKDEFIRARAKDGFQPSVELLVVVPSQDLMRYWGHALSNVNSRCPNATGLTLHRSLSAYVAPSGHL